MTVIEARTRPGGRVLTYRDPSADGLYAETGAEYVDATDEYDHRFCKELGLKVMTAKFQGLTCTPAATSSEIPATR